MTEIERLRGLAAKLTDLLSDPHPGLSGWQSAVAWVRGEIAPASEPAWDMTNEQLKSVNASLLTMIARLEAELAAAKAPVPATEGLRTADEFLRDLPRITDPALCEALADLCDQAPAPGPATLPPFEAWILAERAMAEWPRSYEELSRSTGIHPARLVEIERLATRKACEIAIGASRREPGHE